MGDNFWFAFFQYAGTITVAVVGYFTLRYKASVENVAMLEAKIESLAKRVVLVESDLEKCHYERRKLIEEKVVLAEELAKSRISVAEKEAAIQLKVIEEVAAAKLSAERTSASLAENTALTVKIAEKLEVIPGKVTTNKAGEP